MMLNLQFFKSIFNKQYLNDVRRLVNFRSIILSLTLQNFHHQLLSILHVFLLPFACIISKILNLLTINTEAIYHK
jgi:hypothetical protein